jgi:hypothetical protein
MDPRRRFTAEPAEGVRGDPLQFGELVLGDGADLGRRNGERLEVLVL